MNRIISILKLTFVLAASLFFQGCVGIVTRGMETRTIEPAMVGQRPATYAVSSSGAGMIENPSSLWLEQNWGKPQNVKRVTRPVRGELWIYNFDRKWCGLVPVVVCPIPLLLPIGRDRVMFQMREGRVAKAYVTTVGGYEAIAGWAPDEGPRSSFFARCDHWR